MRVEFWADLVCPWCSIGKRRLGRALGRYAQALERARAELRPLSPRGTAASPGGRAPGGANDVPGSEGSCAVPGEPAQAEGRNR
jgi:hypothetical protein